MTDRKLVGLALTVCLVLSVVTGGGTVALLSDSETVTAELDVDVPEAGNAPIQGSQVTKAGNVPAPASQETDGADDTSGDDEKDAPGGESSDSPGNSGEAGSTDRPPGTAGNAPAAAGNAPTPEGGQGDADGEPPAQVDGPDRAARSAKQ